MLIVGAQEVEDQTVTVRTRGVEEQVTIKFEEFLALVDRLQETRSLTLE